ncbi:hypothetical protein [Agrobacterium sp. NPDC090273]
MRKREPVTGTPPESVGPVSGPTSHPVTTNLILIVTGQVSVQFVTR